MAATRPRGAGKATVTPSTSAAARGDPGVPPADQSPNATARTGPRRRNGVGVVSTVVTVLAGVLLIVGVTLLWMGMFAYENLNADGRYTVDQQIAMAASGVYAGAALVAASLVALGLVAVGLRVARP